MESKSSITDHWINTPNGRLFARSWKPLELGKLTSLKAPILLFHDSLGSVQLWRNFPALLSVATGRSVYAYDRLGFGLSEKREDSPTVDFIENEAKFYFPILSEQLNVNKFVLFGHSVGGAMAVVSAGLFPDKSVAVITESAQAFVEARTIEGILKAKELFKNPDQIEKLKKYHGDKAKWVLSAWIDVWLSDEFSTWSLRPYLSKVSSPALVIHGDQDEYGSLEFPNTIHEMIGEQSEISVFEGCGHIPHREKEKEVLNRIKNFLDGKV